MGATASSTMKKLDRGGSHLTEREATVLYKWLLNNATSKAKVVAVKKRPNLPRGLVAALTNEILNDPWCILSIICLLCLETENAVAFGKVPGIVEVCLQVAKTGRCDDSARGEAVSILYFLATVPENVDRILAVPLVVDIVLNQCETQLFGEGSCSDHAMELVAKLAKTLKKAQVFCQNSEIPSKIVRILLIRSKNPDTSYSFQVKRRGVEILYDLSCCDGCRQIMDDPNIIQGLLTYSTVAGLDEISKKHLALTLANVIQNDLARIHQVIMDTVTMASLFTSIETYNTKPTLGDEKILKELEGLRWLMQTATNRANLIRVAGVGKLTGALEVAIKTEDVGIALGILLILQQLQFDPNALRELKMNSRASTALETIKTRSSPNWRKATAAASLINLASEKVPPIQVNNLNKTGDSINVWQKRATQLRRWYALNEPAFSHNIDEMVLGMLEDYTFIELLNRLRHRYPDAPLPRGWEDDLENNVETGYPPKHWNALLSSDTGVPISETLVAIAVPDSVG